MADALTEAQAARAELHQSVYWPAAQRQKGSNHLWQTDQHLAAVIADLTIPLPPPLAVTVMGVARQGQTLQAAIR